MSLPQCHSRRDIPGETNLFFCAHPQVHVRDQLVHSEICRLCKHCQMPAPATFRPEPERIVRRTGPCFFLGAATGWRDCQTCRGHVRLKVFACQHQLHTETTVAECQKCQDYEPLLEIAGVRRWSVGMTTAPREIPTLERTLQSLAAAGFESLRLFAEPDSPVPSFFPKSEITWRNGRLGAFPNWYLALAEMVLREPVADAYFLCQDDVIFATGLRRYLEESLWPVPQVGVVSVFCPSHYGLRKSPGFHKENHGWDTWGALAYIFPAVSARSLLSHPHVMEHRRRGPLNGMANVDCVVGRWCQAAELPYLVHVPSLAQHTGDTSTLWPTSPNLGRRTAASFAEELPISEAKSIL